MEPQRPATLRHAVDRIDPDAVQLAGDEAPSVAASAPRPAWKVLHLPAADDASADESRDAVIDAVVARGRAYLDEGRCERLLLDTADPRLRGGTGRRADPAIAAAVARHLPVTLSGGLDPANVALALRAIPAAGVDVASGVEARSTRSTKPRDRDRRPRKDPLAIALFAKRARAARDDHPTAATRAAPVHAGLLDADTRGRWGTDRDLGGRWVPETLHSALVRLEHAWMAAREDATYWAELNALLSAYAGRPTPLTRVDRLSADLRAGHSRMPEGSRLYLKREDLLHTGAHKLTNALGQALLARQEGKRRLIAETGAGQHGVATATAAALLGLPCVVYMGALDMGRQRPNVLRMQALGATVRPVHAGTATLKDAINDAMRDWVSDPVGTHYVLGSAMGPHPFPTIVRDLQRVIGDEAAAQVRQREGRLPDVVIACVGGGSNAIGLFSRFIGETRVRIVAVEAAGDGVASGRHAATLRAGSPGIIHGARTLMLQDADGAIAEAHSISAGLDYPGVGPQLAALLAAGRIAVRTATDDEALAAMTRLARTEGILPALEPAHALAALPELLADLAPELPPEPVVLLGLSGRGDKDLGHLERALGATP
jgi:tryptophan synthase beta chain